VLSLIVALYKSVLSLIVALSKFRVMLAGLVTAGLCSSNGCFNKSNHNFGEGIALDELMRT